MGRLLLALVCYCGAQAAVIAGVVLDRATGRPLARSLVALRPVEGTGGKPQSTRANRAGQFRFGAAAGFYLLRASRAGFAPFQYGQKQWKSAGWPLAVETDGSLFLDIRLRRYGAISGTVFDENEVGIPDQKVVAYAARTPLQVAATALTDDRGVYRIHGLEPGTYYVRSAAKQLEDDTGLVPTFHKETTVVDQSMTVDVDLDQQADDVDIRPLPGKLFRITGSIAPGLPAIVTLISDVGRTRVATAGTFAFEQLAPGKYELTAEADDGRRHGKLGGYLDIGLDHDTEITVQIHQWNPTEFRMQDEKGAALDPGNARITARRKDLDGGGRSEVLKLDGNHAAPLGPGRWELSVAPPGGYYAIGVEGGSGLPDAQRGRADGWTEVLIRDWSTVTIKLSSRAASLHGLVSGSGHDPAPGAPVYLEAFDKDAHRRLGELRVTRTDIHGRYRFTNLGPGVYRILGTFEYDKPETETMDAANARLLNLEEGSDTAQDLDLYAIQ